MKQEGVAPRISIGPRVRKSPYFDATLRYGAKGFTIYNHMFMPTVYTDGVAEYWSLVNDVTLWDVACERQVEIIGPDAARFAQLLTPRNLEKCKVGQCKYVILTDEDGGIVNDAVLMRLAEDQYWISPGDGDVLLWARGVAVGAGMDVTVREPDVSPLQLQGPKSPQVAQALFGDWVLDLRYYYMRETELDGIPLVVSRTGWSGELGYEIFLRDSRYGEYLWEAVMSAGKPYNIAPIAPSTIRSIEGAILSYVSDITPEDNPFVIGFERMVDLDQEADFIGKAALRRIHAEGVKRHLVGVELQGPPLVGSNEEFWPVCDDGEVIGRISRSVYSPRLEKNIGLANVPIAKAEVGTPLSIDTPMGEIQAKVVPLPFIESDNKRRLRQPRDVAAAVAV